MVSTSRIPAPIAPPSDSTDDFLVIKDVKKVSLLRMVVNMLF